MRRLVPLVPLVPLVLLAASLLVGGAGCAVVKPWQREVLALRPMTAETETAENKFRQHWQDSREGSTGGFAAAGGGCGCN